jgi:predicted GIY-YIG superfamily endonuclease
MKMSSQKLFGKESYQRIKGQILRALDQLAQHVIWYPRKRDVNQKRKLQSKYATLRAKMNKLLTQFKDELQNEANTTYNVYAIEHRKRIIYVGYTRHDLKVRFKDHFKPGKNNNKLCAYLIEHKGEASLCIKILKQNLSLKEEAEYWESFYIRRHWRKGTLFNVSQGAYCFVFREEFKAFQRANLNSWYQDSNGEIGRIWSLKAFMNINRKKVAIKYYNAPRYCDEDAYRQFPPRLIGKSGELYYPNNIAG